MSETEKLAEQLWEQIQAADQLHGVDWESMRSYEREGWLIAAALARYEWAAELVAAIVEWNTAAHLPNEADRDADRRMDAAGAQIDEHLTRLGFRRRDFR